MQRYKVTKRKTRNEKIKKKQLYKISKMKRKVKSINFIKSINVRKPRIKQIHEV